jgi:acyl dehydratase
MGLYLDDLSVGQVFRSGTRRVEAEDIKRYAREFDPQPFHLDETTAAATFFRGLAASGWHTASLTMGLLVDGGGAPIEGGLIGAGVEELRWPRPTRPGDVLRVESEILEVRPSRSKPGQGILRVRITTLNQADEPVQVMIANLIAPRRVDGVV